MVTPYEQLRDWEKVAYLAARDSYNYDDDIPVFAVKPSSKFKQILRNEDYEACTREEVNRLKRLRSRRGLRGNIPLGFSFRKKSTTLQYSSVQSYDSLAVYYLGSPADLTMVLAFRGTDPCDPVRFMNYIPDTFEAECMALLRRDLRGVAVPENLRWGTLSMVRFMESNNMTWSESEQYGTRTCPDPCVGCKLMSKEDIQLRVCQKFCNFTNPLSAYPSKRRPDQNLRLWNVYQYPAFVKDDLLGGENRAQQNSDCYADRFIVGSSTDLTRRTNVSADIKHQDTAYAALYAVKTAKPRRVIFTGHSLGGSLAFNTYKIALELYSSVATRPVLYFAGFNPASLRNFDTSRLERYDDRWQERAKIHRISGDVVSFLSGKREADGGIPVTSWVTGERPLESLESQSSDTKIHGIFTFQTCPAITTDDYNVRRAQDARSPLIDPYLDIVPVFNFKGYKGNLSLTDFGPIDVTGLRKSYEGFR